MGFWKRRQHRHYIDALEILRGFAPTHSFEPPKIQEQPELAWQQSNQRRSWNNLQATLRSMVALELAPQNPIRLVPGTVAIMHLPEPRETTENLAPQEAAS